MNSQIDQSQIAQQANFPIAQQNNRRYIKYHDIEKYESQKVEANPENHDCRPIYINWSKQKSHQVHNPFVNRINAIQWLIENELSQCCLSFRLTLTIGFRKHGFIQIIKIRKLLVNNNMVFDQQGLKYKIQHGVSFFKIQVSITKDHSNKVWKEIQIPVKSYEAETVNTLKIYQNLSGDILLGFNQYQFMFNLKVDKCKGQFLFIRGDFNINNLQFQQMTELIGQSQAGCSQSKCLIF